MSIAQGLIDNTSLRLLDLSSNRVGSKGVMLLCEALKGNSTLNSLFLDTNGISSEGAYALSDLLLDRDVGLLELHLAWNLICGTGLNSLFTALAMTNRKLKFLDIAYNFVDISVIHALRCMLERNPSLKYLAISDLYKFNDRAVDAVCKSFQANEGLKMVDVKSVTEDFYLRLVDTVNISKRPFQIEFRRDEKFLRRRTPQAEEP
jgi:Ran GTPase-activating protein (RanGAP) involved in mRNA processing and transport